MTVKITLTSPKDRLNSELNRLKSEKALYEERLEVYEATVKELDKMISEYNRFLGNLDDKEPEVVVSKEVTEGEVSVKTEKEESFREKGHNLSKFI